MFDPPPARWTRPQWALALLAGGTVLAVGGLVFTDRLGWLAGLPVVQGGLVLAVLLAARRQQGHWRWLFAAGPKRPRVPPPPVPEPPHFARMRDPASTARTLRNFLLLAGGLLAAGGVCGLVRALDGGEGWLVAAVLLAGLGGLFGFLLFVVIPARASIWGWDSFPPVARRLYAIAAAVVWMGASGVAAWGVVRANAEPPPAEDTLPPAAAVPAGADEPPNVTRRIGSANGRVGRHTAAVEFSPDGRRVLAAGADGVRVFDAATLRPLLRLPPPELPPREKSDAGLPAGRPGATGVAFGDGGRQLLVGGGASDIDPDRARDGWYQVWGWGEEPAPAAAGPTGTWTVGQMTGHPEADELLVGRGVQPDGYFTRPPPRSVRRLAAEGWQPCALPRGLDDEVRRLVWSPDGGRVFAVGRGAAGEPGAEATGEPELWAWEYRPESPAERARRWATTGMLAAAAAALGVFLLGWYTRAVVARPKFREESLSWPLVFALVPALVVFVGGQAAGWDGGTVLGTAAAPVAVGVGWLLIALAADPARRGAVWVVFTPTAVLTAVVCAAPFWSAWDAAGARPKDGNPLFLRAEVYATVAALLFAFVSLIALLAAFANRPPFAEYAQAVGAVAGGVAGLVVLAVLAAGVYGLDVRPSPLRSPRPWAGPGLGGPMALSADGTRLAAAGGATVHLYDITGRDPVPVGSLAAGQRVAHLALSPAGDRLLVASDQFGDAAGTLELFAVPALTRLAGWQAEAVDLMLVAPVFSPDGRTVAAGTYGGRVRLFDAATLAELPASAEAGPLATAHIAVSPDGRWLAEKRTSGSYFFRDRPPPPAELRVWDLADPAAPPVVRPVGRDDYGLPAFGPDGATVGLTGAGRWKDADGTEHPPTPPAVFAVPGFDRVDVGEWKTAEGPVRWAAGGRATAPGLPVRVTEVTEGRRAALRVDRDGRGPVVVPVGDADEWWPLPDGRAVVVLSAGVVRVIAVP